MFKTTHKLSISTCNVGILSVCPGKRIHRLLRFLLFLSYLKSSALSIATASFFKMHTSHRKKLHVSMSEQHSHSCRVVVLFH